MPSVIQPHAEPVYTKSFPYIRNGSKTLGPDLAVSFEETGGKLWKIFLAPRHLGIWRRGEFGWDRKDYARWGNREGYAPSRCTMFRPLSLY